MELVVAATLWGLFSAWLLFPHMGVPRMLRLVAGWLIFAELIATGFWSYGSEGCTGRPCATLAEAGRMAASQDVPGLALVVVGLAGAWGMRARRRTSTRARA